LIPAPALSNKPCTIALTKAHLRAKRWKLTCLVEAVKQLCTVQYTIKCPTLWKEKSYKNPYTNQKWRDATFDLGIVLGNATLQFLVVYKDDLKAMTEARY
jgi:hypothetical protein